MGRCSFAVPELLKRLLLYSTWTVYAVAVVMQYLNCWWGCFFVQYLNRSWGCYCCAISDLLIPLLSSCGNWIVVTVVLQYMSMSKLLVKFMLMCSTWTVVEVIVVLKYLNCWCCSCCCAAPVPELLIRLPLYLNCWLGCCCCAALKRLMRSLPLCNTVLNCWWLCRNCAVPELLMRLRLQAFFYCTEPELSMRLLMLFSTWTVDVHVVVLSIL